MDIHDQDLEQAVRANVIDDAQAASIKEISARRSIDHNFGKFDLVHVTWSLAFFGLAVASGIYLLDLWADLNHRAMEVLLTSTVFGTTAALASIFFHVRNLRFLSALSSILFTLYLPIVGSALAAYLDISDFQSYLAIVGPILAIPSVVGLVLLRFPLLSVAVWAGVSCFAYAWLVAPHDAQLEREFLLRLGASTLLLAYLFNIIAERNYTFWLNKVGLFTFWGGMRYFISSDGHHIDIPFLWFSLGLIGASVFLRYPSYICTGVLGVLTYVDFVAYNTYFKDHHQQLALVIAVQALALLVFGLWLFLRDTTEKSVFAEFLEKVRPKSLRPPLSFGY
jgi:hypothetical protein